MKTDLLYMIEDLGSNLKLPVSSLSPPPPQFFQEWGGCRLLSQTSAHDSEASSFEAGALKVLYSTSVVPLASVVPFVSGVVSNIMRGIKHDV